MRRQTMAAEFHRQCGARIESVDRSGVFVCANDHAVAKEDIIRVEDPS
jgi:hypothetical protein